MDKNHSFFYMNVSFRLAYIKYSCTAVIHTYLSSLREYNVSCVVIIMHLFLSCTCNTHLHVIHALKSDKKYVVVLYTYLLQFEHIHVDVYQFSFDIKFTHMHYVIVNLVLFYNIFYHTTCVCCYCLDVTYM